MGQIVRRKKKGRPSKADLARRSVATETPRAGAPDRDVRRSLRRRNVRYIFDFDDFIDEDEVDVEDELGREKKLKLLLKLQSKEGGAELAPGRTRRVAHASAGSASSSDSDDDDKPLKKRKVNEDDEVEGDVDDGDYGNGFDGEDEEVLA